MKVFIENFFQINQTCVMNSGSQKLYFFKKVAAMKAFIKKENMNKTKSTLSYHKNLIQKNVCALIPSYSTVYV